MQIAREILYGVKCNQQKILNWSQNERTECILIKATLSFIMRLKAVTQISMKVSHSRRISSVNQSQNTKWLTMSETTSNMKWHLQSIRSELELLWYQVIHRWQTTGSSKGSKAGITQTLRNRWLAYQTAGLWYWHLFLQDSQVNTINTRNIGQIKDSRIILGARMINMTATEFRSFAAAGSTKAQMVLNHGRLLMNFHPTYRPPPGQM